MDKVNRKEFEQKIIECFKDHPDCYSWRDIAVSITKNFGYVNIEVSQMYEYLPMDFNIMMKLSKVFGTTDFDVNQSASRGCETCDYGSKYCHDVSFKSAMEFVDD